MITSDMFIFAPSFIFFVQFVIFLYCFLFVHLIRIIIFNSSYVSTILFFNSLIDVH